MTLPYNPPKFTIPSSVTVPQSIVMQLAQKARGNVFLQERPGVFCTEYRLMCNKCKAEKKLDYGALTNTNYLLQELSWAEGHAHLEPKIPIEARIEVPDERKLKVVL